MRRNRVYDRIAHGTRKAARKLKHDIQKVPRRKALGVAVFFAIICIVVIGILLFVQISQFVDLPDAVEEKENKKSDDEVARACETDEDCVPASCCHAFRCVNRKFAPNCAGIACTQECQPETLDCGQGRCVCVSGLCEAHIQNP